MDVEFQPRNKEFEANTIKQHQLIELNNNIQQPHIEEIVQSDPVGQEVAVEKVEEEVQQQNNNTATTVESTTTTTIVVGDSDTNNNNNDNKSVGEISLNNSTTAIVEQLQQQQSSIIESSIIESPYLSSTSSAPIPPLQLSENTTTTTTTTPETVTTTTSNTTTNTTNSERLHCKMHRSNYIMTQIGGKKLTEMTLEQLLDEANPMSGMGYKLPGPQGFLEYVGDSQPPPTTTSNNSASSSAATTPTVKSTNGKHNTSSNDNLGGSIGSNNNSKRTSLAPQSQSPVLVSTSSPKLKSSSSSVRNSGTHLKDSAISGTSDSNGNNGKTGSSSTKDRKSNGNGGGTKTSTLGRLQKNEEERRKRKEQKRSRAREKPILVAGIEDLPTECIKMVKKSKIPEEKLIQHLNILLPILRFRTGYNLRHVPIVTSAPSNQSLGSSSSSIRTSNNKSPEISNTNSIDNNTSVQNNTNNNVITTTTTTTTNSSNNIIPLTTTASQSSHAPYHPSHNGNEDDDYDDGSRLENAILPKGTVDLIETDRDVKKLYKNLKQIGSGGFGSVFLAKSTVDKCEIAIKKIAHVSAKAQRTNLNEIGFLNFCKHPNVVSYLRSHLVDETIWIAMEYMQGGTLTEASQGHTFNESCIAYVAKGMLEGLMYLHAHNIVHRDIKSGNIMMTIDGKIKIVDFGLCVDANERKLVHMAGSPFWMSPEMIRGESYSCPTDIWSFAICLLELANGEPPHRKSSLTAMFTTATEGCNGLDKPERWTEQFTNFLNLCLEMDPQKRSTAEQLLKHPWLNLSENPETMKKILAQIFIANVMNHLDN